MGNTTNANENYFDINIIKSFENYQDFPVKKFNASNFHETNNEKSIDLSNNNGPAPLDLYVLEINESCDCTEIMKSFLERISKENTGNPVYIALDFSVRTIDDSLILDFINKSVGLFNGTDETSKEPIAKKIIQIAVCSANYLDEEDLGSIFHEVNCIITRNNYRQIDQVLSEMSYGNLYQIKEIPSLMHPVQDSDASHQIQDVKYYKNDEYFPFDLVIKEDNGDPWFLNKVQLLLKTEKSKNRRGGKIENIHIRISSRIHLDTYYETDTVLQDIINIYKFAYLIAWDIYVSNKNNNSKIIVVGYETTSSILIKEISKILEQLFDDSSNKITQAVFVQSEKYPKIDKIGYDIKFLTADPTPNENKNEENKDKDQNRENYKVYTVICLGTTMSTIYKIHAKLSETLGKNADLSFDDNYSIITVSDSICEKGKELSNNSIESQYWNVDKTNRDPEQKRIYVNPENKGEQDVFVKYYISVPSKWEDAKNCSICNTEWNPIRKNDQKNCYPLIQINSANGYPRTVFQNPNDKPKKLLGNKERTNLPTWKENNTRIEELLSPDLESDYHPVTYSHISREDNHYLFYIDFSEITKGKRAEKIITWAREQRGSIASDAINIVVSPLNINNSNFVKIVVDNTFSGNMFFLHFKVNEILKDTVKSKFFYIIKEIKDKNKSKINFYYVDDALVTGTTIARAKRLMRMLVKEAELDEKNISIFKKIFLLINRNSYQTIDDNVHEPLNDLHSYINVFTPSYNTVNNYCPGCVLYEQYELLKKRSATVEVANEFAKMAEKQFKRTTHQYDKWIDRLIFNDEDYYNRLKSWLSGHKGCKYDYVNEIQQIVNENDNSSKTSRELIDKIINGNVILSKETRDLIDKIRKKDDDTKKTLEKVISRISRHIVAEKAYIRFTTMNKAFYSLIIDTENGKEEPYKTAYKKIVALLADDPCKDIFESNNNSEYVYNYKYYQVECFESYIRVISKDNLSVYYHVKKAIMIVMYQILDILISPADPADRTKIAEEVLKNDNSINEVNNNWETIKGFINNNYSDKSRLSNIIIRCLAMLGSSRIYRKDFIEKIMDADLFGSIDDSNDQNNIAIKFTTYIKMATMLSDDYAACWRLNQETEKLKSYNPDGNDNEEVNK